MDENDAKALRDKLSRYKYAFMTEEQIAKEKKREAMREMAEKLSYSALEKNILSSRFSRCHVRAISKDKGLFYSPFCYLHVFGSLSYRQKKSPGGLGKKEQ